MHGLQAFAFAVAFATLYILFNWQETCNFMR